MNNHAPPKANHTIINRMYGLGCQFAAQFIDSQRVVILLLPACHNMYYAVPIIIMFAIVVADSDRTGYKNLENDRGVS